MGQIRCGRIIPVDLATVTNQNDTVMFRKMAGDEGSNNEIVWGKVGSTWISEKQDTPSLSRFAKAVT